MEYRFLSVLIFIKLSLPYRKALILALAVDSGFPHSSIKGVGSTKKWERIESYGPKFVENIVQAVSRDILCYAMKTLRHCFIVGHVHDELIIECSPNVDLNVICQQMGRSPDWMPDILLRADGYETSFYK